LALTFKQPFAPWCWKETNNTFATYLGRKFIDYPSGVKNTDEPVFEELIKKSFCLWKQGNK
jgi:hypothetical protein